MSVVVGLGFPEEVILVSDSRISFDRNTIKPCDELRKIYQLGPNLALGFTSQHVTFTLEVLRKITIYVQKTAKSKTTYYLAERIPKVAIFEYKKLADKIGWAPRMEFVYTGVVTDRALSIPGNYIFELMKEAGSAHMPPKIGRAMMSIHNGLMTIPPPSPCLRKQVFPSGEISSIMSYGFIVSGSGSGIADKIKEGGAQLFFADSDIPMRISLIRSLCDDYVKLAGIESVGGLVQILKINEKGVSVNTFSRHEIGADGKEKKVYSLNFIDGKWIEEDSKTGKKVVVSQNPLLISTAKKMSVGKSSWEY